MRYFDKKLNMLCFDPDDLEQLFKQPHIVQILQELKQRGYSLLDGLPPDKEELRKIAYSMDMINDKEDVEIFLSLYVFLKFYPQGSKICFLLNNKNKPESIRSLDDLKASLKEQDINDFIIQTEQGLVAHQLKAYYGKPNVNELFEYIKKVLLKYGNSIGSTNLLIFLKGPGEITNNLFFELNEKLQTLNINGTGNILIAYNENGEFTVLNNVYPSVSTNRIKYEKLEENL